MRDTGRDPSLIWCWLIEIYGDTVIYYEERQILKAKYICSYPTANLSLVNLEMGLYPDGNVFHHFVAVLEDIERGEGNAVQFAIVAGNDAKLFAVNRTTGWFL